MSMRPKISWSDLRGAKAGVWGLGVEGMANLRKLTSIGVDPVLVDDQPQPDGPDGRLVLATADGGLEALAQCEVVVKTPGISRYRDDLQELQRLGIPVVGGLGLWLQEAPRDRVVCITGTKGKSSTTAIAGHLLTSLGYRCMTGGNIGQPPYDPLLEQRHYDYWVIETSSYQATDLACSPPVVAVTSLHPDHLPWHQGVDNYFRDKLSACSQPGAELTIANGDSDLLLERRALLGPRVEWVCADDDPASDWMVPLGLIGAHSRRNALIARACLRALGVPEADDENALRTAAAGFEQLASRLQVIGVVDGVTFVDDSLSTNVLPTLAAMDAFPAQRVALIAGGQDRGIDYGPLAAGLSGRQSATLVLTVPDSGPRIHAAIQARQSSQVEAVECGSLDEAVRVGFGWAHPDGVVLLSPAAPSFGQFRNYRDRGDAFARAMKACSAPRELTGEPQPPRMGGLAVFEDVAVPGLGDEPDAGRLLEEIGNWVDSEPLRALVRRFGNGNPSGEIAAQLAYLDEFTAREWNFRRDEERNQVDADAVTGADEQLVIAAADALGLVRPRPPRYRHYDHVVMLGGLVRANLWRTEYAAHLLRHEVTADAVVAISAYRDLARNEKDPSRDEYELLDVFGLPRRSFEWEVMEDGLRRAFGLPAFSVEQQSGPDAEGPARYRVAAAEAGTNRVSLVVAPALEPGRRANTADGYRYWADQVGHVKPGQRILAVTTCIYVPYQHAVALQHLGIPFGCSIDTVGVDFGVIDDTRSPQAFRGVHYLLEIRSAIRAFRHLVGLLDQEGSREPAR
jgi:UDP-N-acetylmuramoyl-L-alanine---L-glutamate ligase